MKTIEEIIKYLKSPYYQTSSELKVIYNEDLPNGKAGLQGWNYQIRLGKILAPAIKEALSALPKGKLDKLLTGEVDPKLLGGALDSFINALSDNDPKGEFIAQLLENSHRDGTKLNQLTINTVYSGNYLEMIKAVIAVISANGFFGLSNFGSLENLLSKTTK